MKANETRNELKVSDSKTYRLKNEERMKNGEERRKTFMDLLTETSWKCYGSTSAWIFFTETIFSPKTAGMHSQGG